MRLALVTTIVCMHATVPCLLHPGTDEASLLSIIPAPAPPTDISQQMSPVGLARQPEPPAQRL